MANYTTKTYPEELKQKLRKLLEETQAARATLEYLDECLRSTSNPSTDMLKEWARKATGWGNYMRLKFKRLEAACINEKDNRYMEIKLECNSLGIAFADGVSKMDSEGYIGPLRTVRNIFEAYVINAENIVSTCRMHTYIDRQEPTVDL